MSHWGLWHISGGAEKRVLVGVRGAEEGHGREIPSDPSSPEGRGKVKYPSARTSPIGKSCWEGVLLVYLTHEG